MNIKKVKQLLQQESWIDLFLHCFLTLSSSSYIIFGVLQACRPWHVHLNNKHVKWKIVLIFSIFSIDINYLLYMYFQLNIDV
jgi:hypothetical protein